MAQTTEFRSVLSRTVYTLPTMQATQEQLKSLVVQQQQQQQPLKKREEFSEAAVAAVEDNFSVDEEEANDRGGYLSNLLDSSSEEEDMIVEEDVEARELTQREIAVSEQEKTVKTAYNALLEQCTVYNANCVTQTFSQLCERQRAAQDGWDRLERQKASVSFVLREQLLCEPRDTIEGGERAALMGHLNKTALFTQAVTAPHGLEILSDRLGDYLVMVIRQRRGDDDGDDAQTILCSTTVRSDALIVK